MLHLNFNPFPTLQSERLSLRQVVHKDVMEIFFLRSDKKVMQFINSSPIVSTIQALQWIDKITLGQNNHGIINWGICLKENQPLIGTICFWKISPLEQKAEIGYTLHPDFHGKGIMQEAFSKVLAYGIETMQLQTIEAYTSPHNIKSTQLLERNGFIRQATIKEKDASGEARFENAFYILKNSKR